MAHPPIPLTATERALRTMEREQRQADDERSAAWGFLWTLFAFKIATVLVIWWAATGSGEDFTVILATTWYWMVIPIAAITGPLLIRWRMLKMRRQRAALQRSEWAVDPDIPVTSPVPETTRER